MQLQFIIYFNHHLHMFVLSYIIYIVRVHTRTVRTDIAVQTLETWTMSISLALEQTVELYQSISVRKKICLF